VIDPRPLAKFPEGLRIHTLANMRDHLQALQEIQYAMAKEQYDKVAEVAEQRLGLTSLKSHAAHDVAAYLPVHLQSVGSEMHIATSRFAVAAKDASATTSADGQSLFALGCRGRIIAVGLRS
jgi:hypothetical protein